MPRRLGLLSLVIGLLVACGAEAPSSTSAPATTPLTVEAQVATSDLYVDAPQRVQIGLVANDEAQGVRLVTSGTLQVELAPAGGTAGTPVTGTAGYVAAPGTEGTADGTPRLTSPDVGRGVYQLDATFDAPGIWEATVEGDVDGAPVAASARFEVLEEPRLPAPGQPALRTENLTLDAPDPEAVDSRAMDGAPIPDPELHDTTIRDALAAGRPILALFATPVYCQSQFCGPTVDAFAEVAGGGPEDAAYVHVEVWHDFQASEINRAAADWLLRDGDLTEPWLFLIDAGGTIVDRWSPLFDPDEVRAELAAL
ncbi:MAG TPA: hypothetical protein VE032_03890 [Actinomycetota bacterium]|nr:hypothetical protein [Actinomycetota bacterium]